MEKLKFICLAFILFLAPPLSAQKYFTRTGTILFTSEAPLEKIEATNQKATSVLDLETGKMEFAVLIKAFQFEKALMQEHFNENYMESDRYPKATFKGKITEDSKVDFKSDGVYPVTVVGALTIHGKTNEIKTEATFTVKDGAISGQSKFEVAVADYDIEIPSVVKDNIAKIVEIDVDISYELFK